MYRTGRTVLEAKPGETRPGVGREIDRHHVLGGLQRDKGGHDYLGYHVQMRESHNARGSVSGHYNDRGGKSGGDEERGRERDRYNERGRNLG